MQPSREDLSRHYASLSDPALLAISSQDLTDLARECYRRELDQRHLSSEEQEEEALLEDGPFPDWLDTAATACSFQTGTGERYAGTAEAASKILRNAGIPSHIVGEHQEGAPDLISVMVPGALALKATSILERDMFNAQMETTWRAHFDELSDQELQAIDAADLCAGLLDQAARLKRAYEECLAKRFETLGQ